MTTNISYLVNDSKTMKTLYGEQNKYVNSNLELIYDILEHNISDINPNAVFQSKSLHPSYSNITQTTIPQKIVPNFIPQPISTSSPQKIVPNFIPQPISTTIPQPISTTIPQKIVPNFIPQPISTTIPQKIVPNVIPQPISTTIPQKIVPNFIPQPISTTIPQKIVPNFIPQPISTTIPQKIVPNFIPQPISTAIPQKIVPNVIPQPISTTIPQKIVPNVTPQPISTTIPQKIVPNITPQPISKTVSTIIPQPRTFGLNTKYESEIKSKIQFMKESNINLPDTSSVNIGPPKYVIASDMDYRLPNINTTIEPIKITEKPVIVYNENSIVIKNISAVDDKIRKVLDEIDPEKLIDGRISTKNKGYNLKKLQEFAEKMGISVSQKKKTEINKEIREVARNNGYEW